MQHSHYGSSRFGAFRWAAASAVVIVAAALIFGAYSFVTSGTLPFLSPNVNKMISAGDYPALIAAYKNGRLSPEDKTLAAAALSDRLDGVMDSFSRDALPLSELYAIADETSGISELSGKAALVRKTAGEFEQNRNGFRSAEALAASGDYLSAYEKLSEIPEGALALLDADGALASRIGSNLRGYALHKARAMIFEGDYDGAAAISKILTALYPDDADVKNLAFSCTDLVPFDGVVQHIFFHPLIAFPERAIGTSPAQVAQDNYMATVYEFNETLRQLYENDYVMIDINSMFKAEYGDSGAVTKVAKRELMLPRGKKPVILSVDDMNYYPYMKTDGQVFKLILDGDGNVATYAVAPDGSEVISRENEIVPILDTFAEEHPDFCYNSAKGTLALTGYNGILGYSTDDAAETAEAVKIVNRLKETGWTFASHSQGHRHTAAITFELFKDDTDRWEREVAPLVGGTHIYVYPFGEEAPLKGDKFNYLLEKGFAMLCGVGGQMSISWGEDYVSQSRRNIDGIALRDRRLYDLFDVPRLADPIRTWYDEWVRTKWADQAGG